MTDMEKEIMFRLCTKLLKYVNLSEDPEADNLIQWVLMNNSMKENNNEIRKIIAGYKQIEQDVYSGNEEALKMNKELCTKRDELYEKQQELRGKRLGIERAMKR